MKRGVLIGSDSQTEWLIPWWWGYYCRYNNFPIAIVDFGMTPQMRKWCKLRGKVIDLPWDEEVVRQKSSLPETLSNEWQATYKGDLWKARQAWFKKPLACLQTPFDLTVWMDTDCEVMGSLEPLFEEWEDEIELALVRDERNVEEKNYSSGVILFQKNASFLKTWAEMCLKENEKYMGDQNALTELLSTVRFKELNPIYNWIMYQGYNVSAVVAHWGAWGKEHIQRFGGLHNLLSQLQNYPPP